MAENGFEGFTSYFSEKRFKQPATYFSLRYWCADHPLVANFHWDHNVWGSSWLFMMLSIAGYLLLIQIVKIGLMWRKKPVPLGPIPTIYRFFLLLGSVIMFVGCLQSAFVEIQETRWLWQRSKSSLEWILCFPVGTRPAGRVFFWSYVFYISKYFEFLGSFILLFRKENPSCGHVFRNAVVVFMRFLWLQFSQSLQILTLLTNTGFHVVMYLYTFLCQIGVAPRWKNASCLCEIVQYVVTGVASIALIGLHFRKEGCSGMESWFFTALIDAGTLPFIFTVERGKQEKRVICCSSSNGEGQSSSKIKDD